MAPLSAASTGLNFKRTHYLLTGIKKHPLSFSKNSVNLHARAAECPGDRSRAGASTVQCPDPLAVEPALTARLYTFALRSLDAVALALLDKAAFHLRHHPEHGQHEMTHRPLRRDVRVEHGNEGLALFALVNQVEDIASVASEAVKPGDHEFVARA